jgi:hypothetical protein
MSVDMDRFQTYSQTTSAAPISPSYFDQDFSLFVTPGTFSSASLSYPGPGSPITLPSSGPNLFYANFTFATLSAMNAAFPLGTYDFTASNSGGSQTVSAAYTADYFTTDIPALTPATFDSLQNVNPTQAFTLSFNSFTPGGGNYAASFFFLFDETAGSYVFIDSFLAPTITSLVIPADIMAPNHEYFWTLQHESAVINGATEVDSTLATNGTFTAGPVPEPPTARPLAVVIIALVGLLYSQSRRTRGV